MDVRNYVYSEKHGEYIMVYYKYNNILDMCHMVLGSSKLWDCHMAHIMVPTGFHTILFFLPKISG